MMAPSISSKPLSACTDPVDWCATELQNLGKPGSRVVHAQCGCCFDVDGVDSVLERLGNCGSDCSTVRVAVGFSLTGADTLLSDMPNLRVLDLRGGNSLTEVPALLLALQVLRLTGNALTSLPDWFLAGLTVTRIRELDLSFNRLEKIKQGLLADVESLMFLNLGGNKLVDIPAGLFLAVQQLIFFNLADNHLQTISGQMFHGLTRMQTLRVSGNQIKRMEKHSFAENNQLVLLDLTVRNEIQVIEQ